MTIEVALPAETVQAWHRQLTSDDSTLPNKYQALFKLRNAAGQEAEKAILDGLSDTSALLRHEVAYCLGQRQDPGAIPALTRILADSNEHPMVRHEAGEALGAIGTSDCLDILKKYQQDGCLEVAETCQLALQRIDFYGGQRGGAPGEDPDSCYLSVDPTPPLPATTPVADMRALLLDEQAPIFQRYRAMFGLRNVGSAEAARALGDAFGCESALLKHEIAYVLGQLQSASTIEVLRGVLEDDAENAMVRHEAAEALGSIGGDTCRAILEAYVADPEPIVAHSCQVALEMHAVAPT
eukprot:jgi/Botrbrau1/12531/Bobra.0169s0073.1